MVELLDVQAVTLTLIQDLIVSQLGLCIFKKLVVFVYFL